MSVTLVTVLSCPSAKLPGNRRPSLGHGDVNNCGVTHGTLVRGDDVYLGYRDALLAFESLPVTIAKDVIGIVIVVVDITGQK
jgi:hypothetical protein